MKGGIFTANNIKGITIEISGNTGPLNTALKDVNKTAGSLQSELNQVNRQLKFDPSNATLLTQKQNLAALSADALKEKQAILKKAVADAQAQFEKGDLGADKVRAVEREYAKVTSQLEGLKKQAADASSVIGVQMEQAGKKISQAGDNISKAGGKISGAGTALTMGVTAPIVGLGIAAEKTGMDFEAQMSRVQAVSGATGDQLKQLTDTAMDLGQKTTFSDQQVAEGMENLAQAGFSASEIMQTMPGMLNLAASSGEDLASSADIAASTLRGFGLAADQAGHVADVLAKNAAQTNAAVSDTGLAMKYIAPLAQNAGWSLEQTTAAIGEMSNAGIKGEKAGTTLRGALTNLVDPSKEQAAAMKEVGLNVYDANGKMNSLSDIIGQLQKGTANMTDAQRDNAVATIMGADALSGMQVLIQDGSGALDTMTQSLKDSDGASQDMANTMLNNTKGSIEQMKGSVENAGIAFSKILSPTVRDIADKVTGLANNFSTLNPETQESIVKFGLLLAAVGPVTLGIGKMAQATGTITSGVGKYIDFIGTIVSKLGLFKTATEVATGAEEAATVSKAAITAATEAETVAAGEAAVATGALDVALLPVIGIAIGVAAAIAGITIGAIALANHLSQSSIPSVQLFGNETDAATKKAVGAYEKLNDSATAQLTQLEINGSVISKDTADKLTNTFDQMGQQIKDGFDKHFNDSYQTLSNFFAHSNALTSSEESSILAKMSTDNDKKKAEVQGYENQINAIISNASNQHRALTQEEQQQIAALNQKMHSDAITALSTTEAQASAIRSRIKDDAAAKTAQEAADVVKNAAKARDETVKTATDQANKIINFAESERSSIDSVKAGETDSIIASAENQKNQAVKKANEMFDGTVKAAQEKTPQFVDKINWQNGQVLSGWDYVTGKATEYGTGVTVNYSDGMEKGSANVKQAAQTLADEASNPLMLLKNLAGNWGSDMIKNFAFGIEKEHPTLSKVIFAVGQNIKDVLGHSVPKSGPLKDELIWMPHMVKNFEKGMLSGIPKLSSASQKMAQAISNGMSFAAKGTVIAKGMAAADLESAASPSLIVNFNGAYGFSGQKDIDYFMNQAALRIGRLI